MEYNGFEEIKKVVIEIYPENLFDMNMCQLEEWLKENYSKVEKFSKDLMGSDKIFHIYFDINC